MTFQILSLSGGGFLGLYTAAVLASLEERSGQPLAQRFDLIAGTSIGGIIALGLAAQTPASQILASMEKNGPDIFSERPPPQTFAGKALNLMSNALGSKYESAPLRKIISEIADDDLKIGDLKSRVIVPAVNLTKGRPQVFKTAHHPTFERDHRLSVVDVALATSAAPTYLPLHSISGELFADGGLYANAPDLLALHEAEHFLDQQRSEIHILSIGTTTSSFSFSNSIDRRMGWLNWLTDERLPSVMIATQQMNSDAMLKHVLGERYLRIDHLQSREQERFLGLDVASPGAIGDLKGLAEASVRDHLPNPILKAMLHHQASEPIFHH